MDIKFDVARQDAIPSSCGSESAKAERILKIDEETHWKIPSIPSRELEAGFMLKIGWHRPALLVKYLSVRRGCGLNYQYETNVFECTHFRTAAC